MSAAADVRDDDAGPEVSQAVAVLEAVITSYRRGRPTDRPSPSRCRSPGKSLLQSESEKSSCRTGDPETIGGLSAPNDALVS
jgi:hypothetical protein